MSWRVDLKFELLIEQQLTQQFLSIDFQATVTFLCPQRLDGGSKFILSPKK